MRGFVQKIRPDAPVTRREIWLEMNSISPRRPKTFAKQGLHKKIGRLRDIFGS